MNKIIATRVAAILLCLHGLIEIGALFIFHPIGSKFFTEMAGADAAGDAYFYALTGFSWGVARLVAGAGIWARKKWAIILGIIVSTATLIIAMKLIPFGVADIFLAIPVLILLLYALFENQQV